MICIICGKTDSFREGDAFEYMNINTTGGKSWQSIWKIYGTCSSKCAETTIPIPLEDLGMITCFHGWPPTMKQYCEEDGFDIGKV
jgi:hypothetical protein